MYTRILHPCFLFLCFFTLSLGAQNETKKWYFGEYAALDFMTSPPMALSNSTMNASEGSASVADAGGNLLFYVCFDTIYNSQHVAMANGGGIVGNVSSTQSALIVKQPGSNSLYYVFMQAGLGFGSIGTGLHYSIVDMSLAAGSGSVIVKNVLMFTSIFGMSEKLAATHHCNGTDVWILGHELESTNFQAYLLSASGINPTPVISPVGAYMGGNFYAGYLKVSPNGRKLGMATSGIFTEMFDFDPATGVVSNPFNLGPATNVIYGCEFSPDGSKFYGAGGNGYIMQWDLCAGSNAAILASMDTIADPQAVANVAELGAMQLAPDGQIYIAYGPSQMLCVIQNPNLSIPACNYVSSAISIAPGISSYGLPNFMNDFFRPRPGPFSYIVNPAISCQTATFSAPNLPLVAGTCGSSSFLYTGLQWNFGDPASGAANTSALPNPMHDFSIAGSYTVQLLLFRACGADTLRDIVTIAPSVSISINSTAASCSVKGSATVSASGGNGGPYNYLWQPTGQTNATVVNLASGVYTITAGDGGQCASTATLAILLQNTLSGTVTPSVELCPSGGSTGAATVSLSGAPGPFIYTWNGSTFTTATISNLASGMHTVSVTDQTSGCAVTLSFQVTVSGSNGSIASLPPLRYCEKEPLLLSAPYNGSSFLWTGPGAFSSTQQMVLISNASPSLSGIYTLTSTDASNCILTSTVSVLIHPAPLINLSATKNKLCAPYCTDIKAEQLSAGAPLAQTVLLMDGQPQAGSSLNYCFTKPGNFSLSFTGKDTNGCVGSAGLYLQAYPKPKADFNVSPPQPVAGLDKVLLTNATQGDEQSSWYWYTPDSKKIIGQGEQASWLFETTGTKPVALVVSNAWGCSDTVIKSIQVTEEFCLYVPNSFTPNGDGKNDTFRAKGYGITNYRLSIFDRWGETIFETSDPQTGWDGSYKGADCKTDIYAWKITASGIDATSRSLQGHVSLLR